MDFMQMLQQMFSGQQGGMPGMSDPSAFPSGTGAGMNQPFANMAPPTGQVTPLPMPDPTPPLANPQGTPMGADLGAMTGNQGISAGVGMDPGMKGTIMSALLKNALGGGSGGVSPAPITPMLPAPQSSYGAPGAVPQLSPFAPRTQPRAIY